MTQAAQTQTSAVPTEEPEQIDPEIMSLLSQMSGVTKNILKTLRNSWFTGPISFFYRPPSGKQENKEVSQKALII